MLARKAADMKNEVIKNDTDKSEDENMVGGPYSSVSAVQILHDPDAHLSAAEKKAIVCSRPRTLNHRI